MTGQVFGSAALLVAAALLSGAALQSLSVCGRRAAPVAGLGALIVITYVAIKLPGGAGLSTTCLLVVMAGSLVRLIVVSRRQKRREWIKGSSVVAGVLAAAGAAVPFIANGRLGLLGVSLDNDTASHLTWAAGLADPATAQRYGLNPAYPLGPHALVDAVTGALSVRLDLGFTGLLVAIVVILGITGAEALGAAASYNRVVAGLFAALIYLVAAYYGEGAFKEPLVGLFLLGIVVHLEDVREDLLAPGRRWLPTLVPLSLMIAGAVYVYSYPALAWVLLTLMLWLAAEILLRPGEYLRLLRRVVLRALAAGGLLALLLIPIAGPLSQFANGVGLNPAGTGVVAAANLGNLAGPLSPYEALGIWNSPDFRFAPADAFHAGELGALALMLLLLGTLRGMGRHRFVLPAALGACAVVYWHSNAGQSPYLTAKALVVAGPVVAATISRGLLTPPRMRVPAWATLVRWLVAAAFFGFAAHSSYEALRDEPVWPAEPVRELLALAQVTKGQSVLFLGHSNFAAWLFQDSAMSAIAADTASMAQAGARSTKPYVYGTDFDFDTVSPASLNRFRWVVTTNTTYSSQPPAAFSLYRRLRMYELWRRRGSALTRGVIEPPGAPGAVLDCRSAQGRALAHQRGIAAVMKPPVVVPVNRALSEIPQSVGVMLPKGSWKVSLQYTSGVPVDLRLGARRWTMPPYLDRPGPVFEVGSLVSADAPMQVRLGALPPVGFAGPFLMPQVSTLIFMPDPDARQLIPLSRSCGRYVDWYRG